MTKQYQCKTLNQKIPVGSSADDVALMVKSILRLPFRVSDIHISEQGSVEYKVYIPNFEPPDGIVLDPLPEDIMELMAQIELEELSGTRASLNFKSLAIVAQMLLSASRKRMDNGAVSGMVGSAWVVGSTPAFCKWIGIKPGKKPTKFFGLPLIENSEFPIDRLALLCTRSLVADHLEAECGFVVAMVAKEG
jgi:hypothetical protein